MHRCFINTICTNHLLLLYSFLPLPFLLFFFSSPASSFFSSSFLPFLPSVSVFDPRSWFNLLRILFIRLFPRLWFLILFCCGWRRKTTIFLLPPPLNDYCQKEVFSLFSCLSNLCKHAKSHSCVFLALIFPSILPSKKISFKSFLAVQTRVWQLSRWPCHWASQSLGHLLILEHTEWP